MAIHFPQYLDTVQQIPIERLTELRVSNGLTRYCTNKAGQLIGLHLASISLTDSQLTQLLTENDCSALEILHIARNDLKELTLKLPALRFLDARGNKELQTVDIKGCPKLEKVVLSGGLMTQLGLPDTIPNLTQLELPYNQLTELTLRGDISNLRFLDVSNNQLKQLPTALADCREDFYLLAIGNQFDDIVSGILRDGSFSDEERRSRLVSYLSQFKDTSKVLTVDTLKVIFLGNTQVGKTTLADLLTGQDHAQRGSTHGVNVFEEELNGTKVIGVDFGGQDYYHSIHFPLFNEQALYLLLWGNGQADAFGKITNATTGEKEDTYPLNYWLGAVEYFMRENRKIKRETSIWKDTHLTLYLINNQKFKNSKLEKAIDLNNKDLKETYGVDELYRFCLAPSASQKDKEDAKRIILDLIDEHKIPRGQPEFYVDLRNSIRLSREAGSVVISMSEFEHTFSSKKTEEIKEAIANLSYSVACHYLDKAKLDEGTPFEEELTSNFIVDLGKFTTWLYEILTIPELREKKNGYFQREDALCWLKTDDAKAYLDFILAFMLHHKIIFEVKGKTDTYVVPQYLKPIVQDSGDALFLEDFEAPLVKYEFESYFHSNVLAELIKQCYSHLLQEEKGWKYLMWKNKVVLFDKKEGERRNLFLDAQMPKEGTLQKPVISLSRHPQKPVNEEFVRKIMEIIENQIEYYDYTKLVRAPNGKYIPFKEIKEPNADSLHHKKSDQFVYEKVVYKRSDFKIFLPNEIFSMKKKIFFSYSHKDEPIKELIDTHLISLKRSEKIEVWHDRMIQAGADWDDTIKLQLAEADIILLLVSANFNNSKYIWEVELAKAIERHNKKQCVVVPIFARECDFRDTPYAKLQGLPRDAKFIFNAEEKEQDKLCVEVANGIRNLIDK